MEDNGDIKRVHTAEFKTNIVQDLLKEVDTLPKIVELAYNVKKRDSRLSK